MNQAGALLRSRSRTLAALVILAVVLTVIAPLAPPFHAQPRIAPDSITYLEANVIRTPIYPLTLRALQRLPRGLDLLAPFQLVVFAASCVLFAYRFARTYGQPLLALILEAAVLGNPQLVSYCFTVLPEALFASVLMIHLSCALALTCRATGRGFAAASASAAALALVKPSGYAAVAGLSVLAVVHRDQWRKLPWLVAPAALAILSVCLGNLLVRGFFGTQAQSGFVRAAYTAPLLERTTSTPYPALTEHLAAHTRPIGVALQSLPTMEDYYLIAAEEYHGIEDLVRRELIEEVGLGGDESATGALIPKDPGVAVRVDAIAGVIANTAIKQHPTEYAYGVAANVYGLWWLPLVKTVGGAASEQSELDDLVAHRPALNRSRPAFHSLPWIAYVAVRVVLALILVCSIAGVFWIFSRSPLRSTVAFVALLLHGYFLLVALAQPGLPRYAMAVWPASALLLIATAGSIRYRESQPRLQ
jgi:hypothetical protein